jgi:hypothetical protein
MAQYVDDGTHSVMQTSPGAGGSGWEQNIDNRDARDVSSAQHVYDPVTKAYVWGWPNYNAQGRVMSVTPVRTPSASPVGPYASGYQFPQSGVPDSLRPPSDAPAGPPKGGGGGGMPIGSLISRLAALGIPALIARKGLNGGGSGTVPPPAMDPNAMVPQELKDLLGIAMKRVGSQQPLFDAINAQAMGGLPTRYQR